MYKNIIYFFAFSCVTALSGCNDNANDVVKNTVSHPQLFDVAHGALPDNQVQAIVHHQNHTWVGTINGLAHFDGVLWRSFNATNSNLPAAHITALAADAEGNIWAGTDRGLAMFDGNDWYRVEKLGEQFITRLLYDFKTNSLWIGTYEGICRYKNKQWERYDDPQTSMIDSFVSSIAVDHNGIVWIGTFDHYSFTGRLLRFDGNTWQSFRLDQHELNSCFPDALMVDDHNILWLGVRGTMGGILVRIDGDDWQLFKSPNAGCLDGAGITSLAQRGGEKWITTANSLVSYDDKTFSCYTAGDNPLPNDVLSVVTFDSAGNQWIATYNSGVVLIPRQYVSGR